MKTTAIFMFILIGCMILGFVSSTSTYFNAFEDSMSLIDNVSSHVAGPLKSVLNILGISKPNGNHAFSAYFYMRSTLDNERIPKSNPFYDDLQFAVFLPKSNFISLQFNKKFFKTPDKYTPGIVLFFGTDGEFLFGWCNDGRMNPFSDDSSYSFEDWQKLFKGTYLDVSKDVLYVKGGGLGFPKDITYKFESDGYYIGIWSKWSAF